MSSIFENLEKNYLSMPIFTPKFNWWLNFFFAFWVENWIFACLEHFLPGWTNLWLYYLAIFMPEVSKTGDNSIFACHVEPCVGYNHAAPALSPQPMLYAFAPCLVVAATCATHPSLNKFIPQPPISRCDALSRHRLHSAVVVMRRSRTASCRAGLTVNRVLLGQSTWDATWDACIPGAPKVNFGWKLAPFIVGLVNHSPARNKKTTTALRLHSTQWLLGVDYTEPTTLSLADYLQLINVLLFDSEIK